MRKTLCFIAVSLLTLLLTNSIRAQDAAELMQTRFEPVLEQTMKARQIPGFSIAVVKQGHTVYAKSFGVKNIDTEEELTTRSLFHMASVTKPFVATAVMQLWEQGKVELVAPVVTYVPYFRMKDKRYKQITVGQMLNHTSGMPDVLDYEWKNPVYDDEALERYVRSLVKMKLVAAPGKRYRYSNMAYEVLGDLIAKVSGETFEGYVETHILAPLGMKDSTLMKPEADPELLTTPHIGRKGEVKVSQVFPYNRMHAPSSTLISNVVDMSRWAAANLNRGELDGTRILKESTYEIMWEPMDKSFQEHGISWRLGEHRSCRTVFHGGHDTGYRSCLILLPQLNLGVVAISNYDLTPIKEITDGAVDALLGFEPKPIR
jgi:CubicO group peptidase (beta-lactamase class C family)